MIYQNHVIDPTFFYDAIEEFSFDFVWYPVTKKEFDDYGEEHYSYDNKIIRGSLQSQGTSLNQSLTGNTTSQEYKFYCKSLYRINIGDFIEYKERYLRVNNVQDYDEYGCRECSLTAIELYQYEDLAQYLKYLNGEELV